MRCVDVIRELAGATGGLEPARLAEHLARCPRCAAWAEREARLGRLWDATRPVEPSAAEWDAVWARLSRKLDQAPARGPSILPSPAAARPWGRAAVVLLGLAQAAALLFFLVHSGGPEPASQAPQMARMSLPPQPVQADVEIEIDPGQLAVIVGDRDGLRVTSVALNENGIAVDPAFDGLNSLEAIAQQ